MPKDLFGGWRQVRQRRAHSRNRRLAHRHLEVGVQAHGEGRLAEAERELRQGLDLCEKVGDRSIEANCRLELGLLALRRGRLDEAESELRHGLDLYEARSPMEMRFGSLFGVACHRGLSSLALRRGRLAEAERELRQGLDLCEAVSGRVGRPWEANCRLGLGRLALRRDRLAEAERELRQGLKLCEAGSDLVGEAYCCLELGRLALRRGLCDEAQRQLERALIGCFDPLGEANCRLELGRLALRRDRLAEAERQLRWGLSLCNTVGDPLGEAHCRLELGRLAFGQDRFDEAERQLCLGVKLYEAAGAWYFAAVCAALLGGQLVHRVSEVSPHQAVGWVLKAVRLAEAGRGAQPSHAESLWWLGELEDVYATALTVIAAAGDEMAGLEVVEAARADLTAGLMRAGLPADTDPEVREALTLVERLQAELAALSGPIPPLDLLGSGIPRVEDRAAALADLQRRMGEAFDRLYGLIGDVAHRVVPEPFDLERLLLKVPEGTWVLAFHLTDEGRLTRVWRDPSGKGGTDAREVPAWQLHLLRRLAVPRSASLVRLISYRSDDPLVADRLAGLAELLLPGSLKAALAATEPAGPLRLVVVPWGPLWGVPWAALPVEQHPLCLLATVSLAPSLAALPDSPIEGRGGRLIALLDPDLKTTEDDRELLIRLNAGPPDPVLHDEPAWFRRDLRDGNRFDSCYVACHGNERPGLAQCLVLSSGEVVLSAAQLATMDLPDHFEMRACATAPVGGGREPIGLATVALARGARHIAATLWPIWDVVSAQLHSAYRQYLREGLTPPAALRQAQLDMTSIAVGRPLQYWAAHVIIGRP
ncbi:MAG: CHAT domain-containing protein [Thermoleophilia bacterium]|nr:CHAT domain-containing protein [Thermoleophilia bacterium]